MLASASVYNAFVPFATCEAVGRMLSVGVQAAAEACGMGRTERSALTRRAAMANKAGALDTENFMEGRKKMVRKCSHQKRQRGLFFR